MTDGPVKVPFAFDSFLGGDPVPNGIDPEIWRPRHAQGAEAGSGAIGLPRFCKHPLFEILRHFDLAMIVQAGRSVDAPTLRGFYPVGLHPHHGEPERLSARLGKTGAHPARRDRLSGADLLLLDGSSEPFTLRLQAAVLAAPAEASLPPDRVVCAHANLRNLGAARRSPIRFLRYHYALAQSARHFARRNMDHARFVHPREIAEQRELRPRWFLSLNGSPKRHRLFLASKLLRDGQMEKGYVSFPGLDRARLEFCLAAPGYLVRDDAPAAGLLGRVDELVARLPLAVDRRQRLHAMPGGQPRIVIHPYRGIDAWPYRQSYFSIVAESEFDRGESARFTEKIFKPIVNLHPFVLLGSPGLLTELRRIGFRTFAPFIDESYDSIRDPWARLEAVFRQIDALCGMSLAQLDEWYRALLPRLLHNRRHLFVRGRREAVRLHGRLASLLTEAGTPR